MRIFALSTWFPHPTVNGSTLRVYHLLRALAARHEVHLAAFTPLGAPPQASIEHLRSLCRSVTVLPHSPFATRPSRLTTWMSSTPRSLLESYTPLVHDTVRAAAADADVAVGFQLSAARYLQGLQIATVFEEAEPTQIEHLWREQPVLVRRWRHRLTWWKHAAFLRRLVDGTDRVTVVSPIESASLARIGCDPAKIRIVPNAAEDDDVARARGPAAPRVVYAGSVTYRPNLEAVVWFLRHVAPLVKAARPDVELWITGSTGGVRTADLPNACWARFTGELRDVKSAIGDAAVAVAPLHGGGGTRLKILEALALGTPMVSTRKGAEGLDVTHETHLLLADTADDFASAVLRVLNDGALAARLSRNGRALVSERYRWSVAGRQLDGVIAEAIES